MFDAIADVARARCMNYNSQNLQTESWPLPQTAMHHMFLGTTARAAGVQLKNFTFQRPTRM
eukprot:10054865-Karenia_brevis.AAC.1